MVEGRRSVHVSLTALVLLPLAVACGDDGRAQGEDGGRAWGDACVEEETGKYSYDVSEPEQACVDLINDYRAEMGQAPLARWTDAEQCSTSQAEQDAAADAAHGGFGACGEMAQNTCPGWGSVDQVLGGCLVDMFCEGPSASGEWDMEHGHHQNMVAPDYTKVACGFFQMQDGSWWVNINFQ